MKQIYFRGTEGYAVIDGVLTYIKAESVVMSANGKLTYIINGKEYRDLLLFQNQKEFENGQPKNPTPVSIPDRYEYREETDEMGYPYIETAVWKMIEGEPVQLWMKLNYEVKGSSSWMKPIIPEDCFFTRIDCVRFGIYRYKDENGKVTEQKGIGLKLRLTDDQQAFIDGEFSAMLEKAKEMGIKLLFNMDCDSLIAVNERDIKELKIDCKSDYDEEMAHFIGLEHFKEIPKANVWNIYSDYVLYEG